MADKLTPDRRSWNMSRIRSKDTKPEIIVRSLLHRMGFRFRVNRKDLPGKPDIVLPKFRTVIFVHGCFWHRHPGCAEASRPGTRKGYWEDKLNRNVARDKAKQAALREGGWRVLTVWECEVKTKPLEVADRLCAQLRPGTKVENYSLPSRRELLRVADRRAEYGLRSAPSRATG